MFGISSLGTNKGQMLHRIQSVCTITNLQYQQSEKFGTNLKMAELSSKESGLAVESIQSLHCLTKMRKKDFRLQKRWIQFSF
jgi:hypothetical protein